MIDQASFTLRGRNPDVLTCIANLSNDEVFTPPEFANRMLDTLAEAWAANHGGANLWADKSVKFLDPCTKSGVFLREITRRLTEGLEKKIPNLQKRVDHILTKQVFGTRITSLLARRSVYCSRHAYAPIYHHFVERAKALEPRYLSMAIPARWFAGGKGLDEFRESMLNDDRLRSIDDYLSASDVFPGVGLKGGVCYFLWDRDHAGQSRVTTHFKDWPDSTATRQLLEKAGGKPFVLLILPADASPDSSAQTVPRHDAQGLHLCADSKVDAAVDGQGSLREIRHHGERDRVHRKGGPADGSERNFRR